MQTRRQSRLEVGVDLVISLLMNIGAQVLFYGQLATAGRSLALAVVVLSLAMPRRYLTRRWFNAQVKLGKRQSSWQSWFEIIADTAIAICMAIILQWFFYGAAATWAKAGGLTGVVYGITMIRRFLFRRLFEVWATRHPQEIKAELMTPVGSSESS